MSPVYTEKDDTESLRDWFIDFLEIFDYEETYVDRRRLEKGSLIRMRLTSLFFTAVFVQIVGRLFYLQIMNADRLKRIADKMYAAAPNPAMPAPIDVSDVINDPSILKLDNLKLTVLRMYDDLLGSLPSIDVVASVGIILGILQVIAGFHPMIRQRKAKKQLAIRLATSLFDKDTIKYATINYVRTKCTASDPSRCDEVTNFASETEDLFGKLDSFIDDNKKSGFFLVLADSGMGKTTFVLNYYVYNQCKAKKYRYSVEVIPLAHKDADTYISSIANPENVVLMLDGFDEDHKAIDDQHSRFKQLVDLCRNFKCVVMTTRTQFFYCDDEVPTSTGILSVGPRALGVKPEAGIAKTYLAPFDENDIQMFISKYYKFKSSDAKRMATDISKKIPYLSARPLLLSHIPHIAETRKLINKGHGDRP